MAHRIRVSLLDDYTIVLAGLRALLAPYADRIEIVEAVIDSHPHHDVDVTMFDTFGEQVDFVTRVHQLARDGRAGAIVVFSFSDDPELVRRLMRAGAHGFISKTAMPDQIVNGIIAASRREPVMVTQRSQRSVIQAPITWPGRDSGLTERESEILALLPT